MLIWESRRTINESNTTMVTGVCSGDKEVEPKRVFCGKNRSYGSYKTYGTYRASRPETQSEFLFCGDSNNPGVDIVPGHCPGRSVGSWNKGDVGQLGQVRPCQNTIKTGTLPTWPTFLRDDGIIRGRSFGWKLTRRSGSGASKRGVPKLEPLKLRIFDI